RDRNPENLAVVQRVETELGGLDRLLDGAEDAPVVGLHDEQARLRGGQGGELVQGRSRAVVVDGDAFEQGCGGTAGPDVTELLPEGPDGLLHVLLAPVEDLGVGSHDRPPWTSVPMRAPVTACLMFPGCIMLKTRIGSPLSMQSEMAVASMTWSWRLSTSM